MISDGILSVICFLILMNLPEIYMFVSDTPIVLLKLDNIVISDSDPRPQNSAEFVSATEFQHS
ncbi:transmembrane protein, putative [Medicago truncatula]|uniref:Transmembrane protein, putative n=1 Tax=Medicago truncatula TaxID=3880 RepID=G7LJ52_MEDTR|nr:transmembrane protein, putative [Medicago truncatula]